MSTQIPWVENTEIALIRIELYSVVIEALSRDSGNWISIGLNVDFQIYRSDEFSKYGVVKHSGSLPILWNLIGASIVSVEFDQGTLEIKLDVGAYISVEIEAERLEQVTFRRLGSNALEHLP
ncbi:hypothetical protein NKJ46_16660 [Mesorhizobium sp. M0166]|uniref:hypothetical protein n=1 Tax=unclassified Mesorhizobium TaxID=325217 RepID=UPI00333D4EC7